MATLSTLSESDRKRLATCYVHIKDKSAVDFDGAVAFFAPNTLKESFKTQNTRSMTRAKEVGVDKLSEGDINRFAVSYLFATSKHDVDWEAARDSFDPTKKMQTASFRTQTGRIVKKFNNGGVTPAKTPRKRKAKTDDEETPGGTGKKKRGNGKAKAEVEEPEQEAGVVTGIDYSNVFDDEAKLAADQAIETAKREEDDGHY